MFFQTVVRVFRSVRYGTNFLTETETNDLPYERNGNNYGKIKTYR